MKAFLEKLRQLKQKFPWMQTRVPEKYVFPIFSLCLGYKTIKGWAGDVALGKTKIDSLFYNGVIYVRFMLPFFISFQLRWAGKDPMKKEYFQTYIGIKLNGEWAVVPRIRFQSDLSSAQGTTGPNYGQAIGWAEGTK